MKNNYTLQRKVLLFLLLAVAGFAKAQQWKEPNVGKSQDNNKSPKDSYLSYFGNDSTNINIMHVPCESADLYYVLSGVIYIRDTITVNGKRYYYRVPQSLGYITEPEGHYLFPRQDTLFLREERETGRLYRYYRDYFGMGETEKLICDMTLEVGNRFVVPNHYCLDEREYEVAQVYYDNGIKTILLTGYMDERIFKEGLFPSEYPLWQESVSDLWGYGYGTADWLTLLCEYKDGVLVYGDANGCFPNVNKVEEIENNQVSIYPNLIKNNDVITIEAMTCLKDVIIVDVFGRRQEIITNQIDNDKWQINLTKNYRSGIYCVIIKTDKGVNYEKVFVLD